MLTTDLPGDRPRRVLLIEESAYDRRRLRACLSSPQIKVLEASTGREAIDASRSHPPDLILLDLGLPLCEGFETLRLLKEDSRTSAIPVIVVSATAGTAEKVRGLDGGAVDYVTKPYDLFELQARIRVALRTKRLQDMLEQRAHVDGLTGLSNRLALDERLATEWAVHKRHGDALAVWLVDLDHFKRVNDGHGHEAGDEVLRRAAALLRSSVRATDTVARYGGEEFVVVAPRCALDGAVKTAERFRERLAEAPITLERGPTFHVTASVGVASAPGEGVSSPAELLGRADQALYRAKSEGRNRVLGLGDSDPPSGPGRKGSGAGAGQGGGGQEVFPVRSLGRRRRSVIPS